MQARNFCGKRDTKAQVSRQEKIKLKRGYEVIYERYAERWGKHKVHRILESEVTGIDTKNMIIELKATEKWALKITEFGGTRIFRDHRQETDDVDILIMARAWCRHSFYRCTCARTRVHAKCISMPQMVGQLLVLRRRASENHKLGRSEVTRAV